MVAEARSLNRKCGGHVARRDQRGWARGTSMGDVRIGKRRTRRPKTRSANTFNRVTGQQSRTAKKSARIQHIHTTHVKATYLGIAHLVTKHSSFLWYHQKAVALMRLNGLIYSFKKIKDGR